jgi:hypothetical protein
VIAAKTAPLVAFLLAGGVFADRLPRRAVMLTADIARMAIQAATAALLLSHTARIWELVVLQALAGTGTACTCRRMSACLRSRSRATCSTAGVSSPPVPGSGWFGSLLCQPLGLALAGVAAAVIGMGRTLWIAAAVDLAAVAALLAAPSVRYLQRPGEPRPEHSAQPLAAD